MDFSKYPNVKRIMDETQATIEEIYQVIEKIEGIEGKNDGKH